MLFTREQLKRIYRVSDKYIERYYEWLVAYMEKWHINTPLRMAAFLAQVGHESGRLRYAEEIASGDAYEGRLDLGNSHEGDGKRYKGRGLIQITGRFNYEKLTDEFRIDFLNNPEWLSKPEYAVMSAVWFWEKRSLNYFADEGDMRTITRKINGGYNGWKDRMELYTLAKMEFGL